MDETRQCRDIFERMEVSDSTTMEPLMRRCSYEEVVHSESNGDERKYGREFENLTVDQCLECLTRWTLILIDVSQDRTDLGLLTPATLDHGTKCVCGKAKDITDKINEIKKEFLRAHDDHSYIPRLRNSLNQLQETLRTNVSIQVSNCSPYITSKSKALVREMVIFPTFLMSVINSLIKMVNNLLLVAHCPAHTSMNAMDQNDDDDDDVSSLMSDDLNLDDSRCRKRKQTKPTSVSSPALPMLTMRKALALQRSIRRRPSTSPSSPSKRARWLLRPPVSLGSSSPKSPQPTSSWMSWSPPPPNTPALDLLEKKKKGQRSGLYQWVLWREALKGETERHSKSLTSLPIVEKPSWQKLSFL